MINWGELKAAAIALQSVNEAAKRASSELPPIEAERFRERVNKRAYRERWLENGKQLATSSPTNAMPLSKSVQSGSEVLQTTLTERKDTTKLNLSKYSAEASAEAANHRQKLKISRAVKDVAAVAESVWPVERGNQYSSLNLNMICSQAAVQITNQEDQGTKP